MANTPQAHPTRRCPACRCTQSAPIGSKAGFAIRRCSTCRTLFVAQLPTVEDAEDYGGYYDEGNLAVPQFVRDRLRVIVADFASQRKTNRWLDVGCGAGALVDAARRAGWTAQGTEIAPQAVDAAVSRGLDVALGDLLELDLPESTFDVISLIEVLEHVGDPGALLARICGLLRPGGLLYLTTPHGQGVSARLLRVSWSIVSPPEHLQLYSISGLRTLIAAAGLHEQRVRLESVNPHELLGALPGRRAARVTTGHERVATSYALNAALMNRRAGVLFKAVANAGLSRSRLGDSMKYQAVRPIETQRGDPRGRRAA